MYSTGTILGWTIVTGLTLTLLNYVVKRVNRIWIMKLPKDSPGRAAYQRFMRFIVGNHRWFGLATTVALLIHFYIQYQIWGFFRSGLVAGGLLITQGFLGAYGNFACKRKNGPWLVAHRIVSVLLIAAVVTHVVIARGI